MIKSAPWWLSKRFAAITLFGNIYIQDGVELTPEQMNHELIHAAQQKELGALLFLLIYLAEWVWGFRTIFYAYSSIRFEKEAYYFQNDLTYLSIRKPFAWKYPFEEKIIQLKG